MEQMLDPVLKIEAEVRVPVATAQLIQLHVTDPAQVETPERESYWLELCLTPRPRNTRICYPKHWTAHRFERVGKVFIVPPGETTQYRSDGGATQNSVLCLLHPQAMNQWFEGELQWTDRRLQAGLDIPDANIRGLMLRLAEEMRHPGFASQMLVELIAAQLSIELGRYFSLFDEIPAASELAPWRLRLIDERLAEVRTAPTLDELAGLCKLSVRQLTRGFRASRGYSIGGHIASSRIEHAKRLLAGDQSIKAIAYSLGFANPSAFCFAFRRATAMTPGEFRSSGAALAPRRM